MIYFIGDTHGTCEAYEKLVYNQRLINATDNDYVIVCGDFGLPFLTNSVREWEIRQKEYRPDTPYTRCVNEINKKKYTLLFVDGNHDNHGYWNSREVEEWHGGKVHKHPHIKNCYHLMRGEIYDIDDLSIFTFGGALSIDKEYRTPNVDWWEQETATKAETEHAIDNLDKHGNSVDIIITHTIPQNFICQIDKIKSIEQDATSKFLDYVYATVKYKHWVAGHFHVDTKLKNSGISILYLETKSLADL